MTPFETPWKRENSQGFQFFQCSTAKLPKPKLFRGMPKEQPVLL